MRTDTRHTIPLSDRGDWEGLAAAVLQRAWVDWWEKRHYFYCKICGASFHTDGKNPKRTKCGGCRGRYDQTGVYIQKDPEASTVLLENSIYVHRPELGAFFKGQFFAALCDAIDVDSADIAAKMKAARPAFTRAGAKAVEVSSGGE